MFSNKINYTYNKVAHAIKRSWGSCDNHIVNSHYSIVNYSVAIVIRQKWWFISGARERYGFRHVWQLFGAFVRGVRKETTSTAEKSAEKKIFLIFVRFPSAQTRYRRSAITTFRRHTNTNGKLSDVIRNKWCDRQCMFDDPNKDTTGVTYNTTRTLLVLDNDNNNNIVRTVL